MITASVPAHMVRAPATPHRAPRHMLHTALVMLVPRERTRDQLAEMLQTRYPNEPIWTDDLVARLIQQGLLINDGGNLGLTEGGVETARRVKADAAHAGTRAQMTEAERRHAAVAGTLAAPEHLTRSPTRAIASSADLAEPPIRPGGQLCLAHPSRVGDRLHYRDGRVTELDGTLISTSARGQTYHPSREGRNADDRRAHPAARFTR